MRKITHFFRRIFTRKKREHPIRKAPQERSKRKIWMAGQRWKKLLEKTVEFENKWNLKLNTKFMIQIGIISSASRGNKVNKKKLKQALEKCKPYEKDIIKLLDLQSKVMRSYKNANLKMHEEYWKRLNDHMTQQMRILEIMDRAEEYLRKN